MKTHTKNGNFKHFTRPQFVVRPNRFQFQLKCYLICVVVVYDSGRLHESRWSGSSRNWSPIIENRSSIVYLFILCDFALFKLKKHVFFIHTNEDQRGRADPITTNTFHSVCLAQRFKTFFCCLNVVLIWTYLIDEK